MARNRTATVARVLGFFLTAAFALLQALDVLMERLGIPERVFTQVTVATVLLLPGAVAAGVLKGFAQEDEPEDAPLRSATRRVRHVDAQPQRPAPRNAYTSPGDDTAHAHFRLAALYEQQGDAARAIAHYERYVELRESGER